MEAALRVLIVEDSESDEALIVRLLERAGFAPIHRRVETASEMTAALEKDNWDIVIADFTMPDFNAMKALHILREKDPNTPFIVVSGTIGEDTAVSMMKAGANDYVMKGNLARLLPAVERELRDAGIRRQNSIAQTALRESEERYRALYDDNPCSYFTIDADGNILSVNRFGAAELGHAVDELVGKPVFDIFYPKDMDAVRHQFSLCLQKPMQVSRWEFRKVRKDGSLLWAKESARSVRSPDGNLVVLVVSEDITERKRTEDEHARLATALEQCSDAIIIADTAWGIHYVNPAFEHISGYGKEEIVGKNMSTLGSEKHDSSFYDHIRETLMGGAAWSGRLTPKKKDGTFYEAEATASPVRDSSGAIINYVTIHRDITQEVRLEKELRQALKLEALGTLAGGIAHDFNNILMAIMGYTEMVHTKAQEGSVEKRQLGQVLKSALRAKDLVKQVLAFSRRNEYERKPVQFAPIVKEVLKLLRSSLPSTIEIREEITAISEESIVLADLAQIHELLMNLATNAAHSMRMQGGILSVGLAAVEADASLAARYQDLTPGRYVRLTVSDTGHGMDAAVMERMFDPYFTTKGLGEGSGMGLSVVQGIVKSHGGAIAVHSEPGKGSTFHVYFPLLQEPMRPKTEEPTEVPRGHERILFADDEESLVALGTELLESLGYHVTAKTRSIEALEIFQADPNAFDLVITDTTMPVMTGIELAKRLMAIRSDIPIILCTGFSELIDVDLSRELGISEFIMKPYELGEFAKTIRRALGQSPVRPAAE